MAPSTKAAADRLAAVNRSFASASPASLRLEERPLLGHLTLDGLRLPVREVTNEDDRARLPREDLLLDASDPSVQRDLAWLMQKWDLRQDVFLLSSPGLYTRRLALTFLHLLNTPFEIVSLHRDVGESELKQGREIREGGHLEYTDSGAVRAAKEGKVLILDGIERVERGVLPLLNNLLEYREMNLEDGTHIVSAARYDLMVKQNEDTTSFIPAHPDFRIIALGVPVPPYSGLPIDPPFRSRFQARYVDPVEAAKVLARQELNKLRQDRGEEAVKKVEGVVGKVAEVMTSLQIAREMRAKMASGITTDSKTEVPLFPQTTLVKLARFLAIFPPPSDGHLVTPSDLFSLLLVAHPTLAYSGPAARRALETALLGAGFGSWCEGISDIDFVAEAAQRETGIFGWRLVSIFRTGEGNDQAQLTFARDGCEDVVVPVACGPLPFAPFPPAESDEVRITSRFTHLLTSLFQLHALSTFDISFVPSSASVQSSSASTSLVLQTFSSLLGYELEAIHLYKELGGRELWMRRVVGGTSGGVTGWEPAPLVKGAKAGRLVWLDGIDTIGTTFGSLSRLLGDRQGELWEGKRLTVQEKEKESTNSILDYIHPSFRIVTTSTKASAATEWLTEEVASNLVSLSTVPMPLAEERALLLAVGCPSSLVDHLELFAQGYREHTSVAGNKSRRLGTSTLVRIAKRLARHPHENLRTLLHRALLLDFLPNTEREQVSDLMDEVGLQEEPASTLPPVEVTDTTLVFRSDLGDEHEYDLARFDISQDPTGASHVPHAEGYHHNAQQTRYIRDIGIDLSVGEHVLLLGNQGTGKNRITDQLLQLLGRPREYIQLHRDSTVQSLMFTTSIEGGVIKYVDSPLIRAVQLGRVLVVDEVDKAPPPVVAVFASLASRGEMTLADGRKIRPRPQPGAGENDIIVSPNFRLILLGNRPGFPFLGNPFLQHLGDSFSTYPISNPDTESELRVLQQLAPELDVELLKALVLAFQDLRKEFDAGTLSYPFSLREALALVRHLRRFPDDSLEQALRNLFDFDTHRPETIDALMAVLRKYRLGVERVGMDAVRGQIVPVDELRKAKEIEFDPAKEGRDTSLSEPKVGKDDGKEHHGGNTFAGGTGGRDTAGLGGRGGYKRLYKGHDIRQIPDSLKAQVPDEIKNRARDMARKELAEKLAEIDMSSAQASMYSRYHDHVISHVYQLVTFLENLEAKEEERVWLKRQADGELDESRLSEGLTGEPTVYKRRGLEKPELGRPQLKPKRIRFVFDVSASMYRNQADGRLARSLEAAVMLLEAFDRLSASGKAKYRIDVVGHSGESAEIPFVNVDALPTNSGDRWKIVEKMALITQYCWPGDETLNALNKAVDAVAEADADDRIVIAVTDANFDRYGIGAEDLRRCLTRNSKVHTSLIAIGEGAESEWLPKVLPGKAFRVKDSGDLARTLRSILSSTLDKGL